MHHRSLVTAASVKLLTLAAMLLASGCGFIDRHVGETCNSRAYVATQLADHITSRFQANAPVRMAIIPFSVPANLSTLDVNHRGLDDTLAEKVHQEFLDSGEMPIVEVFNRPDWPGKKEEFFTGNFNAIQLSREAGYDFVMVGYLEGLKSLDELTAYTKIIEVESGITLWYGQSRVESYRPELHSAWTTLGLEKNRPANLTFSSGLVDELARCIVQGAAKKEDLPRG